MGQDYESEDDDDDNDQQMETLKRPDIKDFTALKLIKAISLQIWWP